MKFIVVLFIAILFLGYQGHSQAPNWSVEPSAFSHSMTVVGVIKVNKNESRNKSDKVAAFINGECRGVASLVWQERLDRYIAYLLVHHNANMAVKAKVSFKFYDASKNEVFEAIDTAPFVVDSLAGGVDAPYVWSNVVLSHEAEIKSLTFLEQSSTPLFSDSSIYVGVHPDIDVTSLIAGFIVPEGASVWANNTRQISWVTPNDFKEPIQFSVQSEDGKVKKDYWVKVGTVMGVDEVATNKANFTMYPNPAGSTLYLQVNTHKPALTVWFTTATGQVFSKTAFSQGAALYKVEISDFATGIYFIRVDNQPHLGVKKLVVR